MTSLVSVSKPDEKSAMAASPTASRPTRVVVVPDAAGMEVYTSAWQSLAAAAVEPNVFHEHWMLLPALRQLGRGQHAMFVLVFAPDPARPHGPDLLCGLFPLERKRFYNGLPLRHLRIWRHFHSVLSTPLIRAGHGPATLKALFDWLKRDCQGSSLLKLDFVAADGPFHQLLIDHCNAHGVLSYTEEITTRALLRVSNDAESYLQCATSPGNRKELRRQRRRLGEMGQLETRVLQPDADPQPWIDGFLRLESSGWKGQRGTALQVHENEQRFFREVAQAAFDRRRLMMLGLFLENQPIALKCNFLMGLGSIAFKIAFDEAYARFSPGVQLEIDNIVLLHDENKKAIANLGHEAGPQWMDSCAISRHSMINRLWKDRRTMQNLLVATGRAGGDLAVSVLPLLRWLKRKVKRNKTAGELP